MPRPTAGKRTPAKANLPTKLCPACLRPFRWRKAWARNWEQVVYCGERCRRQGRGKPAVPASP